ncbi:MAG: RNA pseudouridine synthase [Lachnospiraceae bacterium]|nr:RNA pseudouridine synthase [Lachnospiraceae bacterium]MDY5741959.1 RNA pseudouridine synthase [Lachnospiraceae bacterium]
MDERLWEPVFEDGAILVVAKAAGLAVQSRSLLEKDLESLLRAEGRGHQNYHLIHRLDQPVEGLLVVAKTAAAAAGLNRQLTADGFAKEYVAVTGGGQWKQPEGTLVDYLEKQAKGNCSVVVPQIGDKGRGKRAELSYRVEAADAVAGRSLVFVRLATGRHHQIRVQLAAAGHPLVGDGKYGNEGSRQQGLALCAWRLRFCHPLNHRPMTFTYLPKQPVFAPYLQQIQQAIADTDGRLTDV